MNPTTESTNDPETIRSEIDQTRERMDQTIDALAERVKGRHLFDELLGFFRSSNGMARARELKDNVAHSTESALHSVTETIKSNPAPAILIGAGITWMIYESMRPSDSNGYYRRRSYGIRGDGFSAPDYPEWPEGSSSQNDPAALAGEYWDANQGVGAEGDFEEGRGPSGEGTAHKLAEGVKSKVGQTVARVKEKTEHLRERSHDWRERAQERSHELYDQGRQQVARTVQTHPLSVGLGCLATGIIAGLLIPAPRRATEAILPQAQRLRERASDVGHDLVERGRHVAEAAVEAIKDEAKHQGLTPEALKEKAKTEAAAKPPGQPGPSSGTPAS